MQRHSLALGVAIATMLGGAAAAREFTADEIRNRIAGNRIFLATPFGGEFPLFYRRDGRVDGTGEALGLGRFIRPTDSGRWWIAGNQLCQQWQTWYDGQRMCFQLIYLGNNRLRWNRDNGESGTARIGN